MSTTLPPRLHGCNHRDMLGSKIPWESFTKQVGPKSTTLHSGVKANKIQSKRKLPKHKLSMMGIRVEHEPFPELPLKKKRHYHLTSMLILRIRNPCGSLWNQVSLDHQLAISKSHHAKSGPGNSDRWERL